MTEEQNPAPADDQIQLQDFHAEAAGHALRYIKDHAGPHHGYYAAACMVVYLEQILKLTPEQSGKNLVACLKTIVADPKLATVVCRMIHEEINASRIVIPGGGRVN